MHIHASNLRLHFLPSFMLKTPTISSIMSFAFIFINYIIARSSTRLLEHTTLERRFAVATNIVLTHCFVENGDKLKK